MSTPPSALILLMAAVGLAGGGMRPGSVRSCTLAAPRRLTQLTPAPVLLRFDRAGRLLAPLESPAIAAGPRSKAGTLISLAW